MRLTPHTLHGRMLLVSAIATLLALLVAGAVIASVLSRFVTEGLDRRLDAEVLVLLSVVDADGRVDRAKLRDRVAALEAGPDWRWHIAGPDGTIGSPDFPVLAAGPPTPPDVPPHRPAEKRDGPGLRPLEGATEEGRAVRARQVMVATRRGPVTLIAAAPREVVVRPIRGALAPLLIALAVLAALLTLALLVQLRVGLRPLRRLREQVAAIRAGRLARVDEDQPAELRPLTIELNALAADNAAALATARGSAANLAHALKTPVAALAIACNDEPQRAALVARIDRTIRHHLARARTSAINRRTVTGLRPAADDVAAAVLRSCERRGVTIDIAITDDIAVAVDPQDVDELLGNLLDNAVRHATARVILSAASRGRFICIDVVDDGPGIPPDARSRMMQPGTRLDERGDGHGFGLSIVAELTSLYGGSMTIDQADGGGLAVRIRVPVED